MAENIDININATGNANKVFGQLDTQLKGLNSQFTLLKRGLATLGLANIVQNALQFASTMVDVSKSTDIALGSVLGFSRAVQQNGGSISDAQTALQKFNLTIGEAANGSASVQQAFQKVNVSLTDLRNLSQTDLLQKTIQGLAKIKDASERARVANELLGKSFKGIDILGLANDYAKAVQESQKYASSIKTADQVQQNLETSVTNLQIALLEVLKPVGDLAKSITTNIDSLVKWIKTILAFVEVIAGFFIILKVINYLKIAVAGFMAFGKAIGDAYRAWKTLSTGFGATIGGIIKNFSKLKEMIASTGVVGQTVGTALKRVFNGLAKGAEVIAGLILTITGLKAAWEKYQEVTEQQNLDEIVDYIDQLNESSTEAWMTAQENARAQREVTEALIKEKAAIQGVTEAYQRSTAEQIASINLQRLSLDMSRDEVEVMNAVDEVIKRNTDAITKLKEQKAGLASDSPLIPAIEKEIKILEESLEADKKNTAEAVRNLQIRQLEQEKLNLVLEQTKVALSGNEALAGLQTQLQTIGMIGDELEDNLVRLDVERELNSKLNELSIRALELEQQRTQLGEARYQQELNNLLSLTNAAYEYADARLNAEKKILEAQRAIREDAQAGAESAIADIEKQFEPYKMGQEAIQKGWGRISDAVDQFVETGKFKFSDFARSIIADLAKMIAKALIFKAISGFLGGFGLKLPGLAEGGPAEKGQPVIVGEKGPELFVPKNSGTVVPNNKLGSASNAAATQQQPPVINNYTYNNNINAVDAKSVAALFYENRKALFGATNQARKEMPYAGAM